MAARKSTFVRGFNCCRVSFSSHWCITNGNSSTSKQSRWAKPNLRTARFWRVCASAALFERRSVCYCHSLLRCPFPEEPCLLLPFSPTFFGREADSVTVTPPVARGSWQTLTHQSEQYDGPIAYRRNPSSKAAVTASNSCAPHNPLQACLCSDSATIGGS